MTDWISVEDSLPAFDQGVLVAIEGGEVTVASREDIGQHIWRKKGVPDTVGFDPADPKNKDYWEVKDWRWSGHLWKGHEWEFEFDDRAVTHWAPLPEPPK